MVSFQAKLRYIVKKGRRYILKIYKDDYLIQAQIVKIEIFNIFNKVIIDNLHYFDYNHITYINQSL